MQIEILGLSLIAIGPKPGSEAVEVELKHPIVETVQRGFDDYSVTAFSKGLKTPRECRMINGLLRFPLPSHIVGIR
ncbi:MAG: hypothetical protein NUV73_04295 [Candidatus Daviesbacteria bacterium]|nr:hypothetical protein [Candidatus Daviesbacteria bacterium]